KDGVRDSGAPEGAGRHPLELRGIRRRETEPARRLLQPLEVPVEPERPAAVDADGLEGRAAAEESLVVRVHDRSVWIDHAAAGHGEREQRHRIAASVRGAPIAATSGRSLTHDSSISSSGSESQTIPPPTQTWMRPSTTAKVRIVSASSKSPFGWIVPSAP